MPVNERNGIKGQNMEMEAGYEEREWEQTIAGGNVRNYRSMLRDHTNNKL